MDLDFATLDARTRYFVMTQTIVPRPIAWVLSENENGSFNLAPFSYFNGIGSDPALFMISVGLKKDGSPKDTRANILTRKHFVVHASHREVLEPMNASSGAYDAEVSEVSELGLQTVPFDGFELPRLADARVAMGCTLYQNVELGKQALIIGEIHRVWIDDAVASRDERGRITVDPVKLDPLGRLGGSLYTSFGEVLTADRPKV